MQDESTAGSGQDSDDPITRLSKAMEIDGGANLLARFGVIVTSMVDLHTDDDVERFLIGRAQELRALATECESMRVFKHSTERLAEFKESFESQTPEPKRLLASWCWLLDRINNAPTAVHRHSAVILCLPGFVSYLPDQA